MKKNNSPGSAGVGRVKKKITQEQLQLAIIKKKECDAKALVIVEHLVEPKVDPVWLIENLKNINRCHMEDVIEERAITKLCGYVLCQKPLTTVINQRYHISLKNKKVYDVTKRKNFCSPSCFGASNYLLEQMFTSPLWLRDKEEIPKFRIFTEDCLKSNEQRGEEIDIAIIEHCKKDDDIDKELGIDNKEDSSNADDKKDEITGNFEDFVLETIKNIDVNSADSKDNMKVKISTENAENISTNNESKENESSTVKQSYNVEKQMESESKASEKNVTEQEIENKTDISKQSSVKQIENEINSDNEDFIQQYVYPEEQDEDDIIEQTVYPVEYIKYDAESDDDIQQNVHPIEQSNNDLDSDDEVDNIEQCVRPANHDEEQLNDESCMNENIISKNDNSACDETIENMQKSKSAISKEVTEKENTSQMNVSKSVNIDNKKNSKSKHHTKQEKQTEHKAGTDVNLAARVEESFQQWITDETIQFLFGDDSVKKKAIEKIEQQDKYSLLCEKLNRLQYEDEKEDAEVLEKPVLKPAPHFDVLREEGQKLDVKVRAFYEGKTTFEEPTTIKSQENDPESETFMPLTDVHAPQTLRRKIFLERLDQVLPDLLRLLAGNNEVYARASINYTSIRSTAVKALVHTFSLNAKNIIFKSAEWTLVGLVIIKMLSVLDPWLATLLLTNQANMYISMILTSYKLDAHYLNLFVASFNPHVNPR